MFKFDAQDYPYASKRHVVYAKNGMSCVGNPSGAAAGLKVLLKGGNAIDAAVAVAAAQPVVLQLHRILFASDSEYSVKPSRFHKGLLDNKRAVEIHGPDKVKTIAKPPFPGRIGRKRPDKRSAQIAIAIVQ